MTPDEVVKTIIAAGLPYEQLVAQTGVGEQQDITGINSTIAQILANAAS
jgi:hypothetical protein